MQDIFDEWPELVDIKEEYYYEMPFVDKNPLPKIENVTINDAEFHVNKVFNIYLQDQDKKEKVSLDPSDHVPDEFEICEKKAIRKPYPGKFIILKIGPNFDLTPEKKRRLSDTYSESVRLSQDSGSPNELGMSFSSIEKLDSKQGSTKNVKVNINSNKESPVNTKVSVSNIKSISRDPKERRTSNPNQMDVKEMMIDEESSQQDSSYRHQDDTLLQREEKQQSESVNRDESQHCEN